MKKICIIGGTGFIGRNLADKLSQEGVETICMSRRPPDDLMPAGVDHRFLDYSHSEDIEKSMRGADAIVDLAFSSQANVGCTDFLSILPSNLEQKEILYHCALRQKIGKYLLVSSGGTVYGQAKELPVNEEHPTRPISTYGLAKLCLEDHARFYQTVHGLPLYIVRPGNPYGPGQKPNRGQGFIAQAIYSILHHHLITIFGDEGTVRDYIYIDDLSRAIIDLLRGSVPPDTYNVGTGTGLSNRDVVKMLEPLAINDGLEMKVIHKDERSVDVKTNVLSVEKIKNVTEWKPKTSIHEGLQYSWQYIKNLKG